jgi:arylformamidase
MTVGSIPSPFVRVVDLSHPFQPGHWRWKPRLERTSEHGPASAFLSGRLETALHAFTHVDAPAHFLPEGATLESLPVDRWVGEATVVDLSGVGAEHGGVGAQHLDQHAQHVRPGDIVLLRTDWDRRMDINRREFWTHGPFTRRDAAEWLADRGVRVVGYDYPPDETVRLDPENSGRFPREQHATHAVFFPRGIGVVEYLANLSNIQQPRFLFVALPLRLVGGDGCPVRAVAIEDLAT